MQIAHLHLLRMTLQKISSEAIAAAYFASDAGACSPDAAGVSVADADSGAAEVASV